MKFIDICVALALLGSGVLARQRAQELRDEEDVRSIKRARSHRRSGVPVSPRGLGFWYQLLTGRVTDAWLSLMQSKFTTRPPSSGISISPIHKSYQFVDLRLILDPFLMYFEIEKCVYVSLFAQSKYTVVTIIRIVF